MRSRCFEKWVIRIRERQIRDFASSQTPSEESLRRGAMEIEIGCDHSMGQIYA